MAELFEWVGLACIPFFLALDLVVQHRSFKKTRLWRLRGLLAVGAIFWVSLQVGGFWASTLPEYTLFDGSALGTWAGALVGVVVYEFFHYWYHRSIHRSDLLWRLLHQMHHSSESHDAFGAYWIHPLDAAMFTTIPILVFFPLLGLTPEAGALAFAFLTFNAMFQHANIRTPRWLGYIIERPESHGVHHERGVHAYNYSDLPLWDIVFGTFKNPETWHAETGYYHGASKRVLSMLFFRDVSSPEALDAPPAPVHPSGSAVAVP
jgi:sterol desaturase/sphingolipid hydroxylase (fatty acid hydroxylase superfamily)